MSDSPLQAGATPGISTTPAEKSLGFLKKIIATCMNALSKEWGLVAIVFILSLIVRLQIAKYELFFEFDSYWHARMVAYILQGLAPPTIDPLAYYGSVTAATIGSPPLFFWYVSAAIYKILTLNAPYHFEWWVAIVKLLPGLYGAFTCVAAYFLGKEFFRGRNEKMAGLFAGILAGVVPSFVYRTMGGFFEDDSFGFLWMVIGFVFFARATRNPEWNRANIINAFLAGLFFAIMAFSWAAFNMLFPILIGIGIVQFFVRLHENELTNAKHYAGLWLISFGMLAIGATIQSGTFWLGQLASYLARAVHTPESAEVAAIAIMALFLACGLVWWLRQKNHVHAKHIEWIYRIIILLIVLTPIIIMVFNIGLRTGDVLGQTIGEESEGKNYFGNKYSILVLFALVGIPAIGYLLLRRSKSHELLAIPLVWLVVTFFMAWGKLKFTYYWGLPLAVTGAIVLTLAFRWASRQHGTTQKAVFLGMGFMLITSMAAGIVFVGQNVPNIETSPGWKEALFWANDNLPQDTSFFNWWDEGHWISFLSNRKVLIDNRNADVIATSIVAQFLLASDENSAMELLKKYNSTHLIFGSDLLEKQASIGFYAFNTTDGSDPRVTGYFGRVLPCSLNTAPLTKEQSYSCGGNKFSVSEVNSFPTKWQSTPVIVQQGQNLFIYRDTSNNRLYAFNEKSNNTVFVRMWMNDSSVEDHFTTVYQNFGDVRIIQVQYDNANTSTTQ